MLYETLSPFIRAVSGMHHEERTHMRLKQLQNVTSFPFFEVSLLLKPGGGRGRSHLAQHLPLMTPAPGPCRSKKIRKETRHSCFHKPLPCQCPLSLPFCAILRGSESNYFSKNRLSSWHFKKIDVHINYGPTPSLSTSSFSVIFFFLLQTSLFTLKSPPHHISSSRSFLETESKF